MVLNIELRNLIKSHLESGKNVSQINLALNKTVPKSTLYRWINHINRTKTISFKKTTRTTEKCKNKEIYSPNKKKCEAKQKTKISSSYCKRNEMQ